MTTTQKIEAFIGSLRAETRLYPDLYAERLAAVLAGHEDPGPLRRDGNGVLVHAESGEPFEQQGDAGKLETLHDTWLAARGTAMETFWYGAYMYRLGREMAL